MKITGVTPSGLTRPQVQVTTGHSGLTVFTLLTIDLLTLDDILDVIHMTTHFLLDKTYWLGNAKEYYWIICTQMRYMYFYPGFHYTWPTI